MNPIIAKIVGITLPVWKNNLVQDNPRAALKTKDGRPINEFIILTRPAVFKNGSIDNVRNFIIFRNVGTTDCWINGNLKLTPNSSLQLGSSNNTDLNYQIYSYDFPADPFNAVGNNRLEIIECVLCELYTSSFQPQGISLS